MLRKRLTQEQKTHAIMDVLCKTPYPITPTQIAKAIGFSKPTALYVALGYLIHEGLVTYDEQQFFDHPARYFRATPKGRKAYCAITGA